MKSNLRLGHGELDGVREVGGFGQPLHALYPQIKAVLTSELGPDAGYLLAEPVVDRAKNRIDWYAEGEPDQKPVPLGDLPAEDRQTILAQVNEQLGRGRVLAERYAASDDARRAQLGAILRAVLASSADTEIFLVEGKPVITGWGFGLDQLWGAAGSAVRASMPPGEPDQSARDVVIPAVAIPELGAAIAEESVPPVESSGESDQRAQSLPPPLPEPAVELPSPESRSPSVDTKVSVSASPDQRERPLESESIPNSEQTESPVASKASAASLLRYVVVGSGYFWSVVAIALLLVLLAAYWGLGRQRTLAPNADLAPLSTNENRDSRLRQAQQEETTLRVQLEQLLVQLAGQRGQCQLPDEAKAGVIRPRSGTAEVAGVLPAPTVGREELALTRPKPNVDGGREFAAPVSSPSTAAVTTTTPPVHESSRAPTETAETSSSVPARTALTVGTQPPSAAIVDSSNPASGLSTPSSSPAPPDGAPPERALEDVLTGRASLQSGPSQPHQPAPEPPVKAEPTPEERREFANRMSATGATTGEITATLLWNSRGDLDLVVRCPSGKQLDFRNPAECGGTLDVDANTARGNLSDRPVENAFWPAGKAGLGVYEISIRYIPRKDEARPQETPFQVRLSRGGQESVFKGTIGPNTVVPVTTFTVQR